MRKAVSPPSGRDFEVYRYVRFDEKTTRQAAGEFGLSQTRICQILRQMDAYLIDVSTVEKDDPRRYQRLHVAEQVAAERVNRLFGRAVRAFENSGGTVTISRRRVGESPVFSSKDSEGDSKYLWLACRIAKQGGTLPMSELESYVEWDDKEPPPSQVESITILQVPNDLHPEMIWESDSPSAEPCSTLLDKVAVPTDPVAAAERASRLQSRASAAAEQEANVPKSRTKQPVQPPRAPAKNEKAKRRREFLEPLQTS